LAIAGDRPWSVWKIAGLIAAILAVIILIVVLAKGRH
jgi:hypothetical protein